MTKKKRSKIRIRRRKIRNGVIAVLVLLQIVLCIVLLFRLRNTNKRIIGTWDYDTVTVYCFDKDWKGSLKLPNGNYEFSYSIENDNLFIDFINENVTDHTYIFSIKGNKLTLTAQESSDDVYVLTKRTDS